MCTAWPLRLFQLRVELRGWVYWVWAGRPRSQGSIPDSKTMILLLCKVPPQVLEPTSRILKLGIGVVSLDLRRHSMITHHCLLMRGTIFNVLLTVRLGLTLVNDKLDARLLYFIISLLQSSTCFEQRRAHHQEVKLY